MAINSNVMMKARINLNINSNISLYQYFLPKKYNFKDKVCIIYAITTFGSDQNKRAFLSYLPSLKSYFN